MDFVRGVKKTGIRLAHPIHALEIYIRVAGLVSPCIEEYECVPLVDHGPINPTSE